jgi:tape measure domain-containing protein
MAIVLKTVSDSKQAQDDLAKLRKSVDGIKTSTENVSNSFSKFAKIATLGLVGLQAFKAFTNLSDRATVLENKLKIVYSAQGDFNKALKETQSIAIRTRSSLEAVTNLYSKTAQNAKTLGASQQDVARFTEIVAKAVKSTSSGIAQDSAAIMQLGQALGSGVLAGDELKSILENSSGLAKAIADGLGVGVGKLKEMGAAGEISGVRMFKGLLNQEKLVFDRFGKLSATYSEAFENLGNSIFILFDKVNKSISNSRGGFASYINDIAIGIYKFAETFDLKLLILKNKIVLFVIESISAFKELGKTLNDFGIAFSEKTGIDLTGWTAAIVAIGVLLTDLVVIGANAAKELGVKFVQNFKEIFKNVNFDSSLIDKLKAIIKNVKQFFEKSFKQIVSKLPTINIENLFVGFEKVKRYILDWCTKIGQYFYKLYDDVIGNSYIPDLVEGVIVWFKKLLGAPVNIIKTFIKIVGGAFASLNISKIFRIDSLFSFIKTLGVVAVVVTGIVALFNKLNLENSSFIKSLKQSNIYKKVSTKLTSPGKVKDTFETITDNFDKIKTIFENFTDKLSNIFERIKTYFQGKYDAFKEKIQVKLDEKYGTTTLLRTLKQVFGVQDKVPGTIFGETINTAANVGRPGMASGLPGENIINAFPRDKRVPAIATLVASITGLLFLFFDGTLRNVLISIFTSAALLFTAKIIDEDTLRDFFLNLADTFLRIISNGLFSILGGSIRRREETLKLTNLDVNNQANQNIQLAPIPPVSLMRPSLQPQAFQTNFEWTPQNNQNISNIEKFREKFTELTSKLKEFFVTNKDKLAKGLNSVQLSLTDFLESFKKGVDKTSQLLSKVDLSKVAVLDKPLDFLSLAAKTSLLFPQGREFAGNVAIGAATAPNKIVGTIAKTIERSFVKSKISRLNENLKSIPGTLTTANTNNQKAFRTTIAAIARLRDTSGNRIGSATARQIIEIGRVSSRGTVSRVDPRFTSTNPLFANLLRTAQAAATAANKSQTNLNKATEKEGKTRDVLAKATSSKRTLDKSIGDTSSAFTSGVIDSLAGIGGFVGAAAGIEIGNQIANAMGDAAPAWQKIGVRIASVIAGQSAGAAIGTAAGYGIIAALGLIKAAVVGVFAALFTTIPGIVLLAVGAAALALFTYWEKLPESWRTSIEEFGGKIKEGYDYIRENAPAWIETTVGWISTAVDALTQTVTKFIEFGDKLLNAFSKIGDMILNFLEYLGIVTYKPERESLIQDAATNFKVKPDIETANQYGKVLRQNQVSRDEFEKIVATVATRPEINALRRGYDNPGLSEAEKKYNKELYKTFVEGAGWTADKIVEGGKGLGDSFIKTIGEPFKNLVQGAIYNAFNSLNYSDSSQKPTISGSARLSTDIPTYPVEKATGGWISGPGGPKDDKIPALLSNGEFVVNAKSAGKNRDLLHAINSGNVPKFAEGGSINSEKLKNVKENLEIKNKDSDLIEIITQATANSIEKGKVDFLNASGFPLDFDTTSKSSIDAYFTFLKDNPKDLDSALFYPYIYGKSLKLAKTADQASHIAAVYNHEIGHAMDFADLIRKNFFGKYKLNDVLTENNIEDIDNVLGAKDNILLSETFANKLASSKYDPNLYTKAYLETIRFSIESYVSSQITLAEIDHLKKIKKIKGELDFEDTASLFSKALEKIYTSNYDSFDLLDDGLINKSSKIEDEIFSIINVPAFAEGGKLSGPGGPTDDKIPAMLSNGEFVINAKSAAKNMPLLHAINSGKDTRFLPTGGNANGEASTTVLPSLNGEVKVTTELSGMDTLKAILAKMQKFFADLLPDLERSLLGTNTLAQGSTIAGQLKATTSLESSVALLSKAAKGLNITLDSESLKGANPALMQSIATLIDQGNQLKDAAAKGGDSFEGRLARNQLQEVIDKLANTLREGGIQAGGLTVAPVNLKDAVAIIQQALPRLNITEDLFATLPQVLRQTLSDSAIGIAGKQSQLATLPANAPDTKARFDALVAQIDKDTNTYSAEIAKALNRPFLQYQALFATVGADVSELAFMAMDDMQRKATIDFAQGAKDALTKLNSGAANLNIPDLNKTIEKYLEQIQVNTEASLARFKGTNTFLSLRLGKFGLSLDEFTANMLDKIERNTLEEYLAQLEKKTKEMKDLPEDQRSQLQTEITGITERVGQLLARNSPQNNPVTAAAEAFASNVQNSVYSTVADIFKDPTDVKEKLEGLLLNFSHTVIDTFTQGLLDPIIGENSPLMGGLKQLGAGIFNFGQDTGNALADNSVVASMGAAVTEFGKWVTQLQTGVPGVPGAAGGGRSNPLTGVADATRETGAAQIDAEEKTSETLGSRITNTLFGTTERTVASLTGIAGILTMLASSSGGKAKFDKAGFVLGLAGLAVSGFSTFKQYQMDSLGIDMSTLPKKRARGGILSFANGGASMFPNGKLSGSGTGTSDSIAAWLSNGEFVINAASTKKFLPLLEMINASKYADGGIVGNSMLSTPSYNQPNTSNSSNMKSEQIFNINITGDVSRQTRTEIQKMIPNIATGVNSHNREKGQR